MPSTERYKVARAMPAGEDVVTAAEPVKETVDQGRQRRLAALRKVAGIWKNRQDIPSDGLEYQRYMRNE